MRPDRRYPISLAVVVAVFGLMLAVAFNTTARVNGERPARTTDLADVVAEMERQRRSLTAQVAELRARADALDRQAAARLGQQGSFDAELASTRRAVGLTAVSGPGIVITLDDAKTVPAQADPDQYVIHDFDVAAVVNALLAGGAKAVDVNGQRVVATTAIRCAGTTILVNQTRLGAPYTISAVGDAARLRRALDEDLAASELLGEYRVQYGLGVKLEDRSTVRVKAYKGTLQPGVATLDGEE